MSKPVRVKKASVAQPFEQVEIPVKGEPKPRKSRAKPKKTKVEILAELQEDTNDIKQQIADLKEDQMKIQGTNLKEIPLDVEFSDCVHGRLINNP